MNPPKQIIVMRKDLNMRKGKIAAQAAHASMAVLLNYGSWVNMGYADDSEFRMPLQHEALREWLTGAFTKICVSVDSEAELMDVLRQATEAGLLCAMITDSGKTEFNGVPTKTCVAVGPAYPDQLDPITGSLKLL